MMPRHRLESPREAQERLLEEIRTEGARSAYRALKGVCDDERATAQAKATAGTTLLRAGGFLKERDDALDDKEPHEMTAAELDAELRAVDAELARRAERASRKGEGSVFD